VAAEAPAPAETPAPEPAEAPPAEPFKPPAKAARAARRRRARSAAKTRRVAAQDRVVPADAPLAAGPEVPQAEAAPGGAVDATAPLTEAPEALKPPPAPARRFARATPWPPDAAATWTCEIGWKAGYRKSRFRAMAAPPGSDKRQPLGDSPAVSWTLMADPEPPTPDLAVRVRALMVALEAAGWEHIGRGPRWYAQRFVWRGEGEPRQVPVPEEVKNGEPAEG
jgi:hypothetical protein